MEYEITKSNSFITFEDYIKNNNKVNNDNSDWGFYIDIECNNHRNIIQLQNLKKIKNESNVLKLKIIKEDKNEDNEDNVKYNKTNKDVYIIFGLLIISVTILFSI